jgi:hypothetical protein
MTNTILIVALLLFGVSAVFRFITHIIEVKDRANIEKGMTAVS